MATKSNAIKKRRFLEALEASLGVVTPACEAVNIARTTYYKWCKSDPDFAKKVDECGEVSLDFAESQLHRQIKDGSTTATIFYLKTKGKKRGYVERIEQSGPNGGPIQVEAFDPTNLTVKERDRVRQLLKKAQG